MFEYFFLKKVIKWGVNISNKFFGELIKHEIYSLNKPQFGFHFYRYFDKDLLC